MKPLTRARITKKILRLDEKARIILATGLLITLIDAGHLTLTDAEKMIIKAQETSKKTGGKKK